MIIEIFYVVVVCVHTTHRSSHIFNSHPLFKHSSIEATFYISVIGSLPTVASRSPRTPRSVETSLRRKVLEKKSTNFNVSLDTSNDDDDISSQDLYHHYQPFNNTQEKVCQKDTYIIERRLKEVQILPKVHKKGAPAVYFVCTV